MTGIFGPFTINNWVHVFEADTTIRFLRPSVLAADTLCDIVTLTFDRLTLVSGHTWRV